MPTTVIVTPIVFDAPIPGTGDLKELWQNLEQYCFDHSRRRLYQILEGVSATSEYGKSYLVTLDMDTCLELNRVLIDDGSPTSPFANYIYGPIVIPGTDFIVCSITGSTLTGNNQTCSINVETGAFIAIENNIMGAPDAPIGRANDYFYRYVLPYDTGQSIAIGLINWDTSVASSAYAITHSGVATVIIDNTTGALTLQAWGQKGVPKNVVDTVSTGSHEAKLIVPSKVSYIDKIVFYTTHQENYDEAFDPIPNAERTILLYAISVAFDGTWTYELISTITREDYIRPRHGGHEVEDGAALIFQYYLAAYADPIEGVTYYQCVLLKVNLATGNIITEIPLDSPPVTSQYVLEYVSGQTDLYNHFHNQRPGYIFAFPVDNTSPDDGTAGLHFIRESNCAVSTWIGGAVLKNRYDQPPYNYPYDNSYHADYSFVDYENVAIYEPNYTFEGTWERWTFSSPPVVGAGALCFEVKVAQFTEPLALGEQTITWE